MSKLSNGGPAFPTECECTAHGLLRDKPGMSLRDWFAGQALAGILSGPDMQMTRAAHEQPGLAALWAYEHADAMLEARKK